MKDSDPIAILSLGTATPRYDLEQERIADWMAASFSDQPSIARWLQMLYNHTGIERRYACIPDFLEPPEHSRFAPGQPAVEAATTAERMAIYERESVKLGVTAAQRALGRDRTRSNGSSSISVDDVTHLIVVSCTGFFAPGLDMAIARRLGLASTVPRTLIGFMGCAAAFNGLRAAHQIVRGQPEARVLVVAVELCSLHVQPGTDRENLISASLFADGASACLVGVPDELRSGIFVLHGLHTAVKPGTRSEMVWQIGDHGFRLRLSPEIPEHLAEAAPDALRTLLDGDRRPDFWAIHPGGPAIVDRLGEIFDLTAEDLAASRSVLRDYGNLSSATILFVLDELGRQFDAAGTSARPVTGVAMAFGPGLVIEMAELTYQPGAALNHRPAEQAAETALIG
jgi:predicted naringenin-chalcone synthase